MNTNTDGINMIFFNSNSSDSTNSYNVSYREVDLSHMVPEFHEPIDYEASLCIADDSYFDLILRNNLHNLFDININHDRSKFKELKIFIFGILETYFKSLIKRGIIEEFNIFGIYSDFDYITVNFNILKNGKNINISNRYKYRSKNYGFK